MCPTKLHIFFRKVANSNKLLTQFNQSSRSNFPRKFLNMSGKNISWLRSHQTFYFYQMGKGLIPWDPWSGVQIPDKFIKIFPELKSAAVPKWSSWQSTPSYLVKWWIIWISWYNKLIHLFWCFERLHPVKGRCENTPHRVTLSLGLLFGF